MRSHRDTAGPREVDPARSSDLGQSDTSSPADDDRAWTIEAVGDDLARRRARESVFTVANGRVGTRGTPPEAGLGHEPLVVLGGVFSSDPGDIPRPLPAPLWFLLDLDGTTTAGPAPTRWSLDMRRGLLHIGPSEGPGPTTTRFASVARPTVLAQRTVVDALPTGPLTPALAVQRPDLVVAAGRREGVAAGRREGVAAGRRDGVAAGRRERTQWVAVHSPVDGEGGIVAAASTDVDRQDDRWTLDRVAVVAGDAHGTPDTDEVLREHERARDLGIDGLLAEHVAGWARRWDDADVEIAGDEDLTRAVRFGLFHLLSVAPTEGEAAVGARGLAGPAYAGHVFWDADVYVLPFLAATMPAAARAMLEYRIARLEPARQRARAEGRRGARFPWESATDGTETTPTSVELPGGEVWPILTGVQEEHIVADIAWAAWHYARWTGDEDFLHGAGGELVLGAARYWGSRVEIDQDGSGHIRGVIGPDEYHEDVDDNCFTNVMARWCLRRGAALATELGDAGHEADRWLLVAATLVDGHRPAQGRHEQFTGYDDLEPLLAAEVATPPFAADVLLGRDRSTACQLVKQPDVLMAHHLVPEEMHPGSLVADLDRYLPRTTHGSSLSPAVSAALLARANRPEEAVELLRMAAMLDLDDRTGTTAGGLHVATMGGVWQALVFGFLGLRPRADGLVVDPRDLPERWHALSVRLSVHGTPLRVRADHDRVVLDAADELVVLLPGGRRTRRRTVRLVRAGDGRWDLEG